MKKLTTENQRMKRAHKRKEEQKSWWSLFCWGFNCLLNFLCDESPNPQFQHPRNVYLVNIIHQAILGSCFPIRSWEWMLHRKQFSWIPTGGPSEPTWGKSQRILQGTSSVSQFGTFCRVQSCGSYHSVLVTLKQATDSFLAVVSASFLKGHRDITYCGGERICGLPELPFCTGGSPCSAQA